VNPNFEAFVVVVVVSGGGVGMGAGDGDDFEVCMDAKTPKHATAKTTMPMTKAAIFF
jgi:hypothetical protein